MYILIPIKELRFSYLTFWTIYKYYINARIVLSVVRNKLSIIYN